MQGSGKTKPAAAAGGGLGLSDYLSLGSSLLAGGQGGGLLSLLAGEADMASLLAMLPRIVEQGNYRDLLSRLAAQHLGSSPYYFLARQLLAGWLEGEQGQQATDKVGKKYQIIK